MQAPADSGLARSAARQAHLRLVWVICTAAVVAVVVAAVVVFAAVAAGVAAQPEPEGSQPKA